MISRTRQPALEAARPGELLGPLRLYSRQISVDDETAILLIIARQRAYLTTVKDAGQFEPGMPRFRFWETAYLLPIPTATGAARAHAAGLGFGLLAK
ncbi:hypothetical protein HDV64DRAFT_99055 [Trichoderma sp. TUCIM 5745]